MKKKTGNHGRMIAGLVIVLLCYAGSAPFVYKQLWEQKTTAAEVTDGESPTESEIPTETESETETETAAESETEAPTETTEPVPLEFVTSDASYFDDAFFIGDSRMVGISMFGKMPNADFFCTAGLSSWGVLSGTRIKGKSVDDYLNTKQYGKVYIMLGINETGDMPRYKENIAKLFDKVRESQPDALIFMMANLHVSAAVSQARPNIGNARLNEANAYIESLTDGQTSFYIDVNPLFDDENHCLPASKSGDGIHPGGMDYAKWAEWLFTQTITEESRPRELQSFGDALDHVLEGGYAMREEWEEGQFLCLITPTVQIGEEENAFDCVAYRTADGRYLPWTAAQEDLLAEDWILLHHMPDPVETETQEETENQVE